jgi:hypothetical protein
MSKTSIALVLAIALAPAAALAASKHQVRHQDQNEANTAYAQTTPSAPSVTEPTYMMIQDRSIGTGE